MGNSDNRPINKRIERNREGTRGMDMENKPRDGMDDMGQRNE